MSAPTHVGGELATLELSQSRKASQVARHLNARVLESVTIADAPICGARFEQLSTGELVVCQRPAGHANAHHWEPDASRHDRQDGASEVARQVLDITSALLTTADHKGASYRKAQRFRGSDAGKQPVPPAPELTAGELGHDRLEPHQAPASRKRLDNARRAFQQARQCETGNMRTHARLVERTARNDERSEQ